MLTGVYLQRFLSKIDRSADCWTVGGSRNGAGYAQVWNGQRLVMAHREAYEHFIGPIPEGLELDHTCHSRDPSCPGNASCVHRGCVNPAHLEPVTHRENCLRGRSPLAP